MLFRKKIERSCSYCRFGTVLEDGQVLVLLSKGFDLKHGEVHYLLKDELFTPGMFLRAHLPVAAACAQQSDIKIEKVFPEGAVVSPENSEQRTVCWELNAQENPEFTVEYSYLHKEVYKDAYHGKGIPGVYDFDLEECAPHIVFTPFIRTLCAELTEGIEDPLMKARAFFDFITSEAAREVITAAGVVPAN